MNRGLQGRYSTVSTVGELGEPWQPVPHFEVLFMVPRLAR